MSPLSGPAKRLCRVFPAFLPRVGPTLRHFDPATSLSILGLRPAPIVLVITLGTPATAVTKGDRGGGHCLLGPLTPITQPPWLSPVAAVSISNRRGDNPYDDSQRLRFSRAFFDQKGRSPAITLYPLNGRDSPIFSSHGLDGDCSERLLLGPTPSHGSI